LYLHKFSIFCRLAWSLSCWNNSGEWTT